MQLFDTLSAAYSSFAQAHTYWLCTIWIGGFAVIQYFAKPVPAPYSWIMAPGRLQQIHLERAKAEASRLNWEAVWAKQKADEAAVKAAEAAARAAHMATEGGLRA